MLKLRYSPTSPFVRKVVMTAIEAGIADRIETVPTDVWSADTDIANDNPLGKVPALVLADGTTLFDSRVICEYLDSLNPGTPLFPPPGPARWRVLRQAALGDGIADAAVIRLLESRRPEALRMAAVSERQQAAITRSLDWLDAEITELEKLAPAGGVTIGDLAVLAALGYLDFRFAVDAWRTDRPRLTAWFERHSQRASVQATRPPTP